MATITLTLEVSDEVVERLVKMGNTPPRALANLGDNQGFRFPLGAFSTNPAWREIIALLVGKPDDEDILKYKLSHPIQERIEELLYLGNEGSQTPEERAELEGYLQAIQFFDFVKATLQAKLI